MSATLSIPLRTPVTIYVSGAALHCDLRLPSDARGLVIFAHASAHSRDSESAKELAHILNDASLATLVCDLLTEEEGIIADVTGDYRTDVPLLTERLVGITDWCRNDPAIGALPVGYFGASTAAAAALVAATERPQVVRAIVLRGGRVDLAAAFLHEVETPTLLVAGEKDTPILEAYRAAFDELGAPVKSILVVHRAGHLFQEPGTRAQLGEHAAQWFAANLGVEADAPAGWTNELC
jgi:putative phosphoribosyl transferase